MSAGPAPPGRPRSATGSPSPRSPGHRPPRGGVRPVHQDAIAQDADTGFRQLRALKEFGGTCAPPLLHVCQGRVLERGRCACAFLGPAGGPARAVASVSEPARARSVSRRARSALRAKGLISEGTPSRRMVFVAASKHICATTGTYCTQTARFISWSFLGGSGMGARCGCPSHAYRRVIVLTNGL
jgi:hypothetical protein